MAPIQRLSCNALNIIRCKNALNAIQIESRRYFWPSGKTVKISEEKETAPGESTKKSKGPFIKNLYAGLFDEDMLAYPEFPSMENEKELIQLVEPVQEYILNCVDPVKIDKDQNVPKKVLEDLYKCGILSANLPKDYLGQEVDYKSYIRLNEAIGINMSISTLHAACTKALNAILLFGNEEQKNKYIKKIASGELTPAFCLVENLDTFSLKEIETVALPHDGDSWNLNGKKKWVVNGNRADFYIVFAKTWVGEVQNVSADPTVFIVDKDSPGISCSEPTELLGTRGVNVCDVNFENVTVSSKGVLGKLGEASNLAIECLTKERLSAGAATVGFLKNLFRLVTDHLIHTRTAGKPLHAFDFNKRIMGKVATSIYALESMVYLNSGMQDDFDYMDTVCEDAVVKIASIEKIREIVEDCATLIGGQACIKGSPLEVCIRDSKAHLLHDIIPINMIKLYVSTLGVQHAAIPIKDSVAKIRNPYQNPEFIWKNLWKERNVLSDKSPPQKLRLQLHPSLCQSADLLELSVIRLEHMTKVLLRRWGKEVVNRHLDLITLADVVSSIYAMTAVLARCSRAYCIGLQNADVDTAVAISFCDKEFERVRYITDKLYAGSSEVTEAAYQQIGDKVVHCKGYCFEHSLKRNY